MLVCVEGEGGGFTVRGGCVCLWRRSPLGPHAGQGLGHGR